MTDKERIEQLLNSINKDFPERIELGKRLKEVYRIMAMDELELLTLDQYQGQNMDYVLQQLQKEGLELGDKMTALDKEIKKKYNVRVVDLQSDLSLLNQFNVDNMTDLPSEIRNGMTITPRNEIPQADYYNKVFDEIVEQNPIDEPDITLNPDGSTTERFPGGEINRDVPVEEFKTMFGGSPADHPMPEILDDLKNTPEYKSAQFQLWSVNLEYQDRQKFKNIIERQYEIFYEFIKENPNLSLENKKILLEEIRKRTLMLDEKYKDFTVKKDVDLSLEELTKFDNELDNINTNFKSKLEAALDNIKLGLPNDLNRDVRNLQIDDLALSDEYKKYLDEIIKDTDVRLSSETIRKLDNVLDTRAGKLAVETIILNLRNGVTKHGAYSLDNLMRDYKANNLQIMGAKQDIAEMYWSRLDEILESHLNPNAVNPDIEMKIQFDFAESKLKELGLTDLEIEDVLKTNKFFKTNTAFTDPEMRAELDELLQKNEGPSIFEIEDEINKIPDDISSLDTPTNVVDERLRLERIIKNDISNPRLKEGLLKRYLDFDEIAKDLPSNIKNELLIYTNKEVINDIDIWKNELNITDLTPGQKESIETIFFDYVEPTPIEDAFLAEMEGWDIDAQGNPINPSNKPEGMSKFQKELINEYNYIVENGQTSAKLSRSYLIDLLMNRPDGQSVEEFIKANNFTQEEIDIIKYETRLDTPTNVVDDVVKKEIKFNKVAESGYPARTKYNADVSDVTYDFSRTNSGSGATKKYAGDKWRWVQVNEKGLMINDKEKLAQAIADDLASGKTVNIAGHGNYRSSRGGLINAVPQSQIDNELIELFQIVSTKIKEKLQAGENVTLGKVISGGQTGFDEAGVKAASVFNFETEVNYSGDGLFRDASGKDINNFDAFKARFDTFQPGSLGAGSGKLPPFEDNVVDFREKQLQKLMEEVEAATPDVTKITPSQAEMIDNALADAAAKLSRSQFNVIEGGIGKKYTAQQILKVAGKKLGKLFVDGITLVDIYELGLIAYALGEPAVELITKLIYPDLKTESPTYGQQVMENFEVITKISPTDRLLMKAADEIEEQFGFRPGDISEEITSVDTSPVRPVLYSPDSDRTVPVQYFTPPSIYEKTKERFQPATLEDKTGYDEYNQFLKGMHGMIGGNNGEK